MARQDRVLFVDHDWRQPAELAHAGRDLLDLPVAMVAGIAAVDLEVLDGAVLDYRCEGLGQVLEVRLARLRLAHDWLVDVVLISSLGRFPPGFPDHFHTS